MAIAMVTGSVSASRASGIDAASRSALAITTACNADWTRRRCMCRPEKGAAAAIKVLDSRLYRPRHPIRARLHGDDVGNGPGRALTDHQANPRRPAKWPAREAFVSAASQSSRRTKTEARERFACEDTRSRDELRCKHQHGLAAGKRDQPQPRER
jgi:hypothetical protein